MKKNWLFTVYRGLYDYKHPYATTTIMESKSCCFFSWLTCFFGQISFPKFEEWLWGPHFSTYTATVDSLYSLLV